MTRKRVSQLLDFVIEMPAEDASHSRGHKLPFVANEAFQTEMQSILDQFFTLPKPEVEESKEVKMEEAEIDDAKFHSFKKVP